MGRGVFRVVFRTRRISESAARRRVWKRQGLLRNDALGASGPEFFFFFMNVLMRIRYSVLTACCICHKRYSWR